MSLGRLPKPDEKKVKQLQSSRKALEPVVRAAYLNTCVQKISEHASKGYKNDSLRKDHLLLLFEVVGSLAKEVALSLEPELAAKVASFREAKSSLRKQVLAGISPPSVTIPLLQSELFSEDLFPKTAFLKVDEEAIKSDEKNRFPAFEKKASVKRPASVAGSAP